MVVLLAFTQHFHPWGHSIDKISNDQQILGLSFCILKFPRLTEKNVAEFLVQFPSVEVAQNDEKNDRRKKGESGVDQTLGTHLKYKYKILLL